MQTAWPIGNPDEWSINSQAAISIKFSAVRGDSEVFQTKKAESGRVTWLIEHLQAAE